MYLLEIKINHFAFCLSYNSFFYLRSQMNLIFPIKLFRARPTIKAENYKYKFLSELNNFIWVSWVIN